MEFYIKSKKSKFAKPAIPLKEQVTEFGKSLLFWKGRKKGMIHTRDITWNDIRVVFAPRTFSEKYSYLGSVPYENGSPIFQAIEPLIIFMDYRARPKWCPRWFLRFLYLFGSDSSVVRVRNYKLHRLLIKLTKGGYFINDYKTKWDWYDLRISVTGCKQTADLVSAIEREFYRVGKREDVAYRIKQLDPTTKFDKFYPIDSLNEELKRLEENLDN